jgi:uncharacterized phage-associated protein
MALFWLINNTKKLFNVALFFINKQKENNKNINHKKLQKLTYYAQAWNLAINNNKLFNNNIEAWVNWPVTPELYRKYRNYWYMNISTDEKFDESLFKKEELKILNEVYKIYWNQDSDYLVWLTHTERPWLEARWELDENETSNNIVKEETMKDFYKSKLKQK